MTAGDRTVEPSSGSRSLWRNRNFLVLWTGRAVSMVGSQVSFVAFPLLVLELTGSPAKAGAIGFLESLPNALFTLPAGALADRWNRKRVMILCDAGRAVALASIPVALWLWHLTLAQLAVVSFVEGTLAVLFSAAGVGALPALVATEQLPDAFAQMEVASRGSVTLGGILAGALYEVGRAIPFLVDAISYAASVLSLFSIPTEFQEGRNERSRNMRAEIMEGLSWVWRQPFIRITNVLVGGSNMVFAAMVLVLIVLARQQHASPASIGTIFSAGGIGGIVGAVVSPWLRSRLSLPQVVIGINWVWALLIPLLLVAPNPLVLGGIFGLMVCIGPLWNVVLGSYETALVPDALRSRVSSVGRFISWGTIPLGSALSGVLLQTIGAQGSTLVLFAVMLLLAVASTASRAIRNARPIEAIGRA
jgi:predicted MFS family arabinose efflux permease